MFSFLKSFFKSDPNWKKSCWIHDYKRIHHYNTRAISQWAFCKANEISAIVEINRCSKCGDISATLKASNGETAPYDLDFILTKEMEKARKMIKQQEDFENKLKKNFIILRKKQGSKYA